MEPTIYFAIGLIAMAPAFFSLVFIGYGQLLYASTLRWKVIPIVLVFIPFICFSLEGLAPMSLSLLMPTISVLIFTGMAILSRKYSTSNL